jgi:hypothetical protein
MTAWPAGRRGDHRRHRLRHLPALQGTRAAGGDRGPTWMASRTPGARCACTSPSRARAGPRADRRGRGHHGAGPRSQRSRRDLSERIAEQTIPSNGPPSWWFQPAAMTALRARARAAGCHCCLAVGRFRAASSADLLPKSTPGRIPGSALGSHEDRGTGRPCTRGGSSSWPLHRTA